MGNTLCGSVVVKAIPNAHTQDDATESSWTLLAAFGGSYAPDITYNYTC